jgi:hypothetical protein
MLLSRACPDKWKLASTVCSKAFHLNIFAVAVGQVRLTSSVPVFASASSAHDKLNKDIGPLIGREGRWILSKDGTAIERCWEFTGFNKAWVRWCFQSMVGQQRTRFVVKRFTASVEADDNGDP